jgi:hypothetical protein
MSDAKTDAETLKAKREKRLLARKNALNLVLQFVRDNISIADNPAPIQAALLALKPMRVAGGGEIRETVQSKLLGAFGGSTTLSGLDAYRKLRYGTPDMRRSMILAIKTGAPERRLWIDYDGQTDEYTLVSIGANSPDGWTGYVPIDASAAAPETGAPVNT